MLALVAMALGGLAAAAAAQTADSAPSGSNATNYQSGGAVSVNPRTAAVSYQAHLVDLPGIVSGIATTFTLSYRQEDAVSNAASGTRFFGMPYGWFFNISFIVNNGTYSSLYVDGTESYVLDPNWRTLFTPTGSTQPVAIATGLKQYNRADVNLQPDGGTVTVNGIASASVLTQLGGMTRYFSRNGLLLQETDRFGNSTQYVYATDTTPESARLEQITDSWGNPITFSYCDSGDSACEAGQVTVTLPDGRTVAWVAPDPARLTKVIDTLGTVTALDWGLSPCGDGSEVLTAVTAPTGAAMALSYTCMPVCTARSSSSCDADGHTTSWPVVDTLWQCATVASGATCPSGSVDDDYLTTRYQLGTTDSPENYTGYPLYSPYAATDPGADALMASNDTAFTYTTVVQRKTSSGTVHDQTESDYNFLHLQTENRVYVRAQQSSGGYGLALAKEVSYCYQLSADDAGAQCTSSAADYQQLPASYQLPTVTGSCVYNVGATADGSQARHSAIARTYDSFGNRVNAKVYHGTDATGIAGTCDRTTRLDTSGLKLVSDVYKAYDTPTAALAGGFLALGAGAEHFGLPTATLSFAYLDDDESGVGAHAAVAATSGPVLVTLMCNTLTSAGDAIGIGTAVAATTTGLVSTSLAAPSTPGVIAACDAPSYDTAVAPPKTTAVTYDPFGRILTKTLAWATGTPPPAGVGSASESYAYALTGMSAGEAGCGSGAAVLQTTVTDAGGYASTHRRCTLNGFALSATDALGRTTLMAHDVSGLTTTVTHPNGTFTTTDYYYACPTAQDGRTATCPSTSAALRDCPYDVASQPRNCQVQTMHAGNGSSGTTQSSYVDGVLTATIHDGLGRNVLARDNLGATAAGFSAVQTRASMTYDSLGHLSTRTDEIGASTPLVYTTTIELDEKLRPKLVCGPRGTAREIVHDDVQQARLVLFNGTAASSYDLTDGEKLAAIASCALTGGQTTGGSTCPTVAADTSTTACPDDAYLSYTLHDGLGLEHSITAQAGSTLDAGASQQSVNGVPVFSADRLQYGYSVTATATDGGQLTASSSSVRELHGTSVATIMSVEPITGSSTTAETDTSAFDARGLLDGTTNPLSDASGTPLQESYVYSPTGHLVTSTSYAGAAYHTYYDELDRTIRYCFASEGGGSEGERIARDPITGAALSITHFTNPSDCSECAGGDCGDVDGDAIRYTYTAFGAPESITYADGTTLQWAYDRYQRLACEADALATASGHVCPQSPLDADYAPTADQQLLTYRYWDDSDPYRRGLLQSVCRGLLDATSGTYVTQCIDKDYYTPVDVGGSSDASLSDIVGAYAGSLKTESLCTGGSCADGTGTLVYQTTYAYDDHARSGLVESVNAAGQIILRSAYRYDQYDNVVHEEHVSDLDGSDASNYQVDYDYDGLMRLAAERRSDATGTETESTTYEYDAGDNLVRKVHQVLATVTATPSPTTPLSGGEATPSATPPPPPPPTALRSSPTSAQTHTPSATPAGADDDGGCRVGPTSSAHSWWLLSMALPAGALLMCRRASSGSTSHRTAGRTRRALHTTARGAE